MVYSGYIPPEYVYQGICSIKSDVFSFGMLLLEILSGKKNTEFYHTGYLSINGYVSNLHLHIPYIMCVYKYMYIRLWRVKSISWFRWMILSYGLYIDFLCIYVTTISFRHL